MPFMEAAMFGPCLPLSLLNNKGDMVCFRHRASLAFGQEHNNTTRLQQISHIVVVHTAFGFSDTKLLNELFVSTLLSFISH